MKKTLFATLLTLLFSGASASELSGYDFNYAMTGNSAVKPIQAFDDGRHLYLQFKDPAMIPVLFINTTDGVIRLPVHQKFPYIVTDTITPEILIKFGGQQAIVKYEGGRALVDNGLMTGASRPMAIASAATIPTEDSHDTSAPFTGSSGQESFAGELIFNQSSTVPAEANRPVVPAPYIHSSSAMPAPAPAVKTKSTFHVVGAGESILSIAHKWKVSMHQLAILNHLWNVNLIYVGQRLRLPAAVVGGRAIIKKTMAHYKLGVVYKKVTDKQGKRQSKPAPFAQMVNACNPLRACEKTTSGRVAWPEHSADHSRIHPAQHFGSANLDDRVIDVFFSDKGWR